MYSYGYPTSGQPWDEPCPERKQGLKHERAYRAGRPFCVYCGANPDAPWPNPARLELSTLDAEP